MCDTKEAKMQITPETPARFTVLNPFESPSDYYTLQEQIVSSPSVFKSTKSSSSPGKFRWSIDQLALIDPVEIDSEDVRRQAMYLSHARIDKETEDRRQKAIEEFFTKRLIVPSPWTEHEGKQVSQFNSTKSIGLNNISPIGRQLMLQPGKSNASCQTVLSLPVDFNLEKILGEYFRTDEFADQSQENLSSSSLRRKLFLEGNANVSECLSPSLHSSCSSQPLGVLCSIDISPVRCRSPLETSSSGQFSSSPIQGGTRAYSLGSITSPTFPEGSPAHNGSPTFSPIAFHIRKTPLSDQRKFTFCSPDIPSSSNRMTPPSTRSPYIDGCSPIKNCSPMRLGACRGTAQYQTSVIRIPIAVESHGEDEEDKENASAAEARFPEMDNEINLSQQDGDTFARGTRLVVATVSIAPDHSEACHQRLSSLQDIEGSKENNTVDMADAAEVLGENTWIKETIGNSNAPMASFMTGITFSIENSRMCVSPLAESSAIPCDNSSIQVDSGYNTQTCGSSIMDTAGAENSCRENDVNTNVFQNKSQLLRTKECSILNQKDNQLPRATSPEKQSCFQKAKPHSTVLGQNATCNISVWKHKNENQVQGFHKNVRMASPRILDGSSASCSIPQPTEKLVPK
ncbi:protein aurora borealis isoform X1 [Falco peregrinus]|uniref:protein aurora borealis isoform X1 n=3 Tax=Falco peregrinus TaxID=8954 RepID=UPI000FFC1D72|nr:protein aurora borealis isoform X1 [Falco peregrinus]XP_027636802.1 protein aurora borealis isoform X1 [Falco peregrinus]XP_027636803.1 protein aurora borealis isoform X1 [Falco peregrinus]XP_027636804.1 protein aurora borealis isoform X1 [Falco peregrinus]